MAQVSRKLRSVGGGGLMFLCPGCDGAHVVRVGEGTGPRWGYNGEAERPTFTPSVFVNPPGKFHNPQAFICHSFITDGRIQFLGDSTHRLAGKTTDLPDWDEDR